MSYLRRFFGSPHRRRRFTIFIVFVLNAIFLWCGGLDYFLSRPLSQFSWPPHGLGHNALSGEYYEESPSLEEITKATGVGLAKGVPQAICNSSDHSGLRIHVKSKYDEYEARAAIRKTWGADAKRAGAEVFFVVGLPLPEDTFEWKSPLHMDDAETVSHVIRLHREADQQKDLVIGNFVDAYRNNTRKFVLSVAGAAGILPGCPPSEFSLFIDADYVVNVARLLSQIRDAELEVDLYKGWRFDSSPFRMTLSKHAVSYAQYPFDRYPPYITAGAVLLSRETVEKFIHAIPQAELYLMDDIYAGILAYLTGVQPVHDESYKFWTAAHSGDEWLQLTAAHGYPPQELLETYNRYFKRV
ncbi:unnamed protein product, partial [Mesorhabditis spiculigera]